MQSTLRSILCFIVSVVAASVISLSSTPSYAQTNSKIVAFNPDGKQIAIVNNNGELSLWNIANQEELWSSESPVGQFDSVTWSPDGTRIATNTAKIDDGVRIWNSINGIMITHLKEVGDPDGGQGLVRWSPDGTKLASVQYTGAGTLPVHIWSAIDDNYRLLSTLQDASQQVYDISWSGDSSQIAVSGYNGLFVATRLVDEKPSVRRVDIGYPTYAIDWNPNSNQIAVTARKSNLYELDDNVHIYDFREAHDVLILPKSPAVRVRWNVDGTRLAIVANEAVNIWDATSGKLLESFPAASNSFSWSPAYGRLAYIGDVLPSAAARTQTITDDVQIVTLAP